MHTTLLLFSIENVWRWKTFVAQEGATVIYFFGIFFFEIGYICIEEQR